MVPYWRLSAFYFFYFASLGALVPYWGLYLQSLGFDAVAIGSLMAILMATKVVAPNVWGWLADHLGHRMRLVRLASLASLLCYLAVFGASGYWGMALVMVLFSFFWNASLPQFEAVTFDYLGSGADRYPRIRVWGSIGFIATVVGVGQWVDRSSPVAVTWAVLLTFVGLFLASLLVADRADGHDGSDQGPILEVLRRPVVIAFFLAVFLMQVSHGPYYAFYTIYLQHWGYSKTAIGMLWGLGVLAEVTLFLFFMHRLLQRYSSRLILVASLALAGLRWLLIGWFPQEPAMLAVAQLLHAASFGSFHASAIHLIHRYFRGRHQGRGQALYASISFGAGGAVGTFASGFVWEQWGAPLAYTLASAVALVGALVLWRSREANR
jgi:PPP family 3-phenylpropionic acid transporter